MSKHDDNEINTNIKQALDDSISKLDANTLSKIRQVRAQAVDKVNSGQHNWSGVMSGAVAMTCVMIVAVMILLESPTQTNLVPLDDLDLISSSESLELYEDLEFYEWLEEDVLQS